MKISKLKESVNKLNGLVEDNLFWLQMVIKGIHFNRLVSYTDDIVNKKESKFKLKNKSNLNRLIRLKFGYLLKQNVRNLLTYNFSKNELNALSYGMNFSLPVKRIDKAIVYLGFEKYLNQVFKLKYVS